MGGRGKGPSSHFSMCSPPDRGGMPESRFPQGHDVPAHNDVTAEIEIHLHISGAAGVIGDGVGAAGDGLTVVVRQGQARLPAGGPDSPPAPARDSCTVRVRTGCSSVCQPCCSSHARRAASSLAVTGVWEGRAVQAVSSISSRHSPARQRFTGTQLLSFFSIALSSAYSVSRWDML